MKGLQSLCLERSTLKAIRNDSALGLCNSLTLSSAFMSTVQNHSPIPPIYSVATNGEWCRCFLGKVYLSNLDH
jgi:recombinational DNA repair protein RecT